MLARSLLAVVMLGFGMHAIGQVERVLPSRVDLVFELGTSTPELSFFIRYVDNVEPVNPEEEAARVRFEENARSGDLQTLLFLTPARREIYAVTIDAQSVLPSAVRYSFRDEQTTTPQCERAVGMDIIEFCIASQGEWERFNLPVFSDNPPLSTKLRRVLFQIQKDLSYRYLPRAVQRFSDILPPLPEGLKWEYGGGPSRNFPIRLMEGVSLHYPRDNLETRFQLASLTVAGIWFTFSHPEFFVRDRSTSPNSREWIFVRVAQLLEREGLIFVASETTCYEPSDTLNEFGRPVKKAVVGPIIARREEFADVLGCWATLVPRDPEVEMLIALRQYGFEYDLVLRDFRRLP